MYKLLIGILEDNTPGLASKVLGNGFTNLYGYPFPQNFNPIYSSEPIIWSLFYFLTDFLDPVTVYNLFVIASFILLVITGYKLFDHFFKNKFISIPLSLILTFSPYMYYQTRSHLNLSQVWLMVLYIFLFLRANSILRYIYAGLVLGLLLLISNYLAFFAIILSCIYVISKITLVKNFNFKRFAISLFSMAVAFSLVSLLFLIPFLNSSMGIFQRSVEVPIETKVTPLPERTYEEFFYFTTRPWYYFLPSIENPWVGHLSRSAIKWLQIDWGYWLTTNHFPAEHTASYLGYANLIFAILGLSYIIKRLRSLGITKQKKFLGFKIRVLSRVDENSFNNNREINLLMNAIILGIIALSFLALSMPPYLTIDLKTIFTPSHFLFLIFPMFRVLSRMGIIILLIQLVFTGFGFKFLLESMKVKGKSTLGYSIIVIATVISLMEFYVPIRLTDVSSPPRIYSYIKNSLPEDAAIAIFPQSKANDSLYWMVEHKHPLVNPAGLKRPEAGFDSSIFTAKLSTCNGVQEAQSLGTDYIVVFNKLVEDEDLAFFNNNNLLTPVYEVEENGLNSIQNKYLNLYNKVDSISFSAKIYRINEINDVELANCLAQHNRDQP